MSPLVELVPTGGRNDAAGFGDFDLRAAASTSQVLLVGRGSPPPTRRDVRAGEGTNSYALLARMSSTVFQMDRVMRNQLEEAQHTRSSRTCGRRIIACENAELRNVMVAVGHGDEMRRLRTR